jgi:hypothetical protein
MIVGFLGFPGARKSILAWFTAEALTRCDITATNINSTHARRSGSAWQRVRKTGLAVGVLVRDSRRSFTATKSIYGTKQDGLQGIFALYGQFVPVHNSETPLCA